MKNKEFKDALYWVEEEHKRFVNSLLQVFAGVVGKADEKQIKDALIGKMCASKNLVGGLIIDVTKDYVIVDAQSRHYPKRLAYKKEAFVKYFELVD